MGANSPGPLISKRRSPACPLRILMPSIVDPNRLTLGAATVTRGLLHLLESGPFGARIHCLPLPSPPPILRRFRQAVSLARSLVSPLPSKVEFARTKRFRRSVCRRLRNEVPDVVLLNGSDLLWLIDELPASLPRVVVAHNIEHRLFDSQIRSVSWGPPPLRCLLDRDCGRLEEYELTGFQRVRNVIFLCAEDAAYAKRRRPDLNVLIQPPVFVYPPHVREMPHQPAVRLEIGFVANLGWWPNREGLGWFLKQVFPHVKDRVRLHLFGERSEEAADPPYVKAHGFVADPGRIWENCHFMICPIFGGGGVSIKVAEAIYNRVPIVASPFAVRGLPLQEDPAVVVLDGPADWVLFLRSHEARALAGRRVSAALAERFHALPYRNAFQRYFADLLQRGSGSRC